MQLHTSKLAPHSLRVHAGPSFLLSLPLVGHGHLLGRDPIAALYRMRARYGPVFRLDIGSLPAVFICRLSDLAALYRGEMANGRPYVEVPTFAHLRPIDKKGKNMAIAG